MVDQPARNRIYLSLLSIEAFGNRSILGQSQSGEVAIDRKKTVREELKEIDRFRIRSREGVRRAAEAFRTYIESIDDLVIGACHNIATMEPMRSQSGGLLGEEVFGWTERERQIWVGNPKVVLDSPLISACRYEADIFWADADGFYSNTSTRYLVRTAVQN